MNINDFENHIDETILARGQDYFISGNVVSLEYDDDVWTAEVEGSEYYTVTASISSSGDIIATDCDCPYDWGPHCKHQVAVFFAIRDEFKSGKQSVKAGNKTNSRESLENLLKKLDKQALISIVLEFSGRDKRMKEELILRYSQKTDIFESARNVIRSAINAVKRRGYVEYGDARRAVDGADTVLQMIDDKIDSGDILTAVSLGVVVSEEMMDLMDCCDDSGGYVGGAISEAIEKINDAVCAIPDDQKNSEDMEKVFDIIFNHATSKTYSGWTDWRMDLLSSTVPLCGNSVNRSKMDKYITYGEHLKKDGWSRNYDNQRFQRLQYDIIKLFDGEDAASSYMEQNLDNSDFRRVAIKTAISEGLYERALRLCLDGENKDSGYAGLVKEWKQQRYIVYEKTKDVSAQKSLCMEFVLQGNFDFFSKLKALHTSDEWASVLKDIIRDLEDSKQNSVYVSILIHEGLKSRLLDYCKKYVSNIDSYYEHLLPEYKNEIGLLFVEYIRKRAAAANGRNNYRDVCELIRHYKKACGEAANRISDELTVMYAKRPAFLDELRKIKGDAK